MKRSQKLFNYSMMIFLLLCCSSCISRMKREYETVTYYRMYQVDSLKFSNNCIYPYCKYNEAFDASSREFYTALDTTLSFRRLKPNLKTHREYERVSAIDWRIKNINVTTSVDCDASHPAGSSINDMLSISFRYKGNTVKMPLKDFALGSIMLSDHYPYAIDVTSPYLTANSDAVQWDKINIRIDDSFGRTFNIVPETGTFIPPTPEGGME